MTKDQVKSRARELYTLASHCQVPMLRACRRINMATSTPHRWLNHASDPGEGQMEALRASILRIAAERGTLPAKYRADFEALPAEQPRTAAFRPPQEIARDLARNVEELQKSLASTEG